MMRILLAEDDSNIATIAKLTLEKLGGHEVHWVSDGSAAISAACATAYDLILLDEMMPEKNGLSAAEELRLKHQVHTPIIFLSAKSQPDDVERFARWGIGHIVKPFDPQTLAQQIEGMLKADH